MIQAALISGIYAMKIMSAVASKTNVKSPNREALFQGDERDKWKEIHEIVHLSYA